MCKCNANSGDVGGFEVDGWRRRRRLADGAGAGLYGTGGFDLFGAENLAAQSDEQMPSAKVRKRGVHVSKDTGNALLGGLSTTFALLGGADDDQPPPKASAGLSLSNPLVLAGGAAALVGLVLLVKS